jgi:hypothetical protein
MKSSWFISILLILATAGCVSVKPLRVTRDTSGLSREVMREPFLSPNTSRLFKASMSIKKHQLTGLLLVKRMDTITLEPPQAGKQEYGAVYRIVFANEMGMTYFDLELKNAGFQVISCFGPLKKRALLKILETDFRLLTGSAPCQYKMAFIQNSTGNRIFYGRSGRYQIWETWSPSGDTLFTAAAKSNIADPAIISYQRDNNGVPMKINVENPVIGLKISLRMLTR